MNSLPYIQLLVFFGMFGVSFWAVSCIRFDKICRVNVPAKVQLLMFLLSFILAYLSTQGILSLTLFNGL